MLLSMTGFGRAEVKLPPSGRAVIEIQTLNHKFLEVECRVPDGFQAMEGALRARAATAVRRGRMRISVNLKTGSLKTPATIQMDVARRYVHEINRMKSMLKLAGPITPETILSLPQVVSVGYALEELPASWRKAIEQGVAQALAQVVQMRRKEGQRLEKTLQQLEQTLAHLSGRIRQRIPAAQREFKERFMARVKILAPEADAKLLTTEAAAMIQGSDVSEEIARIQSHLLALKNAMAGKTESPGRTIDFLAQELHREVNTLGSKLREAQITQWVVDLKGQIEKLREQAANIE